LNFENQKEVHGLTISLLIVPPARKCRFHIIIFQKKGGAMRVPIEITYRNVAKRDAIEHLIHEKADKLNEFHDGIVSCRISIEQDQESKRSGNQFHVRISLRVPPGQELVVHQKSDEEGTGESLRTVINDAFKTMSRQLKKLKQKQRGQVKGRAEIPEPVME